MPKHKTQFKIKKTNEAEGKLFQQKVPESFIVAVKEIMTKINSNLKVQPSAIEALYTGCEGYLATMFNDSQLCATNDNRVTVNRDDIQLVQRIRRNGMNRYQDTINSKMTLKTIAKESRKSAK